MKKRESKDIEPVCNVPHQEGHDPRLEAINTFAALARGYCEWCEHPRKGRHPGRLAMLWLSRVHEGVLNLPKVSRRESIPEGPGLRELQEREGRRRTHLYMFQTYYRKVFDPDPKGTEDPLLGSVVDDLVGVYSDLSNGLRLHENGYPLQACRQWVSSYENHWGMHATGALTAIYFETSWRLR